MRTVRYSSILREIATVDHRGNNKIPPVQRSRCGPSQTRNRMKYKIKNAYGVTLQFAFEINHRRQYRKVHIAIRRCGYYLYFIKFYIRYIIQFSLFNIINNINITNVYFHITPKHINIIFIHI